MKIKKGDKAPEFALEGSDGKTHSLAEYKGKRVLLYFYPKDNTPGCTTEAEKFRDLHGELVDQNLVIFGISADSVKSHQGFAKKFKLPFVLLSDPEKGMINAYEAWGKKKFMGREYEGILRISFLIDEKGKIARVYDEVKPKEHATEVLGDVCMLR